MSPAAVVVVAVAVLTIAVAVVLAVAVAGPSLRIDLVSVLLQLHSSSSPRSSLSEGGPKVES